MTDAAAIISGAWLDDQPAFDLTGKWIAQASRIADKSHPRGGRNIYRTFPTAEEAALWRSQVRVTVQRSGGARLRSRSEIPTLEDAGAALLDGMAAGAVRKRGGGEYRPGVIRAYRRSLALYVYPDLGPVRSRRSASLTCWGWSSSCRRTAGLRARSRTRSTRCASCTGERWQGASSMSTRRAASSFQAASGSVTVSPTRPKRRGSSLHCPDSTIARCGRSRSTAAPPCRRAPRAALGGRRPGGWSRPSRAEPLRRRETGRWSVETDAPKTKAGWREVPIAPPAHDALVEWKTVAAPDASDYVWQAEDEEACRSLARR